MLFSQFAPVGMDGLTLQDKGFENTGQAQELNGRFIDPIKPAYSRTSGVDFKALDQNVNVGHKYSQKNKLKGKKRTVNKRNLSISVRALPYLERLIFHVSFLCVSPFHCL